LSISKAKVAMDTMFNRLDRNIDRMGINDKLSPAMKKIYCDTSNVIIKLLSNYKEHILLNELIGLEQRLLKISEILFNDLFSQYFVSFKWVYDKDILDLQLDYSLNPALYDIQSMNIIAMTANYKEISMFNSMFKLFMIRIKWVIDKCVEYIKLNRQYDTKILKLYVLTTIMNTFEHILINNKIEEKYKESIRKDIYSISSILIGELEKSYLDANPSLISYISLTIVQSSLLSNIYSNIAYKKLNSLTNLDPQTISKYNISWIVINLWESNTIGYDYYKPYIDIADNYPASSLAPYVLASFYLNNDIRKTNNLKNISIGVQPYIDKVNMNDVVNLFFPRINEIQNISINEHDLSLLYSYYDDQIRQMLLQIILINPNLDSNTKRIAEIESKKSHSGYEISDMDIPINIGGKTHYVCFPIKSGQEIRTNTVPISYLYQLTRPYLQYHSGSCIFMTAKPCSQPFRNQINLLTQRNFPIYLLESENLCKLFKLYNLI